LTLADRRIRFAGENLAGLKMRSRPLLNCAVALVAIALGACNQVASHPVTERADFDAPKARACTVAAFFPKGNYSIVDMTSNDPAVRTALAHAGRVMDESEAAVSSKYCMFEKLNVKSPERCFHFFFKIPTPGGGGKICTTNDRNVSRVYLEE
jgi:hypothetical protein